MTGNALDDPEKVECSAPKFREFFCPHQKFLAFKLTEIWPIL